MPGGSDAAGHPAREGRPEIDLRLPGIILTVTGIIALVVTYVRGANLGISKRAGMIAGAVLLVIGVLLLVYGTSIA